MIKFFVGGERRPDTEKKLRSVGGFVLRLDPESPGDGKESFIKTSLSLIDMADVVVFPHDWAVSPVARVQHEYCALTGKPVMYEGLDGLTDGTGLVLK